MTKTVAHTVTEIPGGRDERFRYRLTMMYHDGGVYVKNSNDFSAISKEYLERKHAVNEAMGMGYRPGIISMMIWDRDTKKQTVAYFSFGEYASNPVL